jgi:hypothetical protein
MLLIGEVKEWTTSAPQLRVLIKHLPDTIVRLPPTNPGGHSGRREEPSAEPLPRQIIGATFGVSSTMGLTMEEFQVVPMSAEWIPAHLGEAWRGSRQ